MAASFSQSYRLDPEAAGLLNDVPEVLVFSSASGVRRQVRLRDRAGRVNVEKAKGVIETLLKGFAVSMNRRYSTAFSAKLLHLVQDNPEPDRQAWLARVLMLLGTPDDVWKNQNVVNPLVRLASEGYVSGFPAWRWVADRPELFRAWAGPLELEKVQSRRTTPLARWCFYEFSWRAHCSDSNARALTPSEMVEMAQALTRFEAPPGSVWSRYQLAALEHVLGSGRANALLPVLLPSAPPSDLPKLLAAAWSHGNTEGAQWVVEHVCGGTHSKEWARPALEKFFAHRFGIGQSFFEKVVPWLEGQGVVLTEHADLMLHSNVAFYSPDLVRHLASSGVDFFGHGPGVRFLDSLFDSPTLRHSGILAAVLAETPSGRGPTAHRLHQACLGKMSGDCFRLLLDALPQSSIDSPDAAGHTALRVVLTEERVSYSLRSGRVEALMRQGASLTAAMGKDLPEKFWSNIAWNSLSTGCVLRLMKAARRQKVAVPEKVLWKGLVGSSDKTALSLLRAGHLSVDTLQHPVDVLDDELRAEVQSRLLAKDLRGPVPRSSRQRLRL